MEVERDGHLPFLDVYIYMKPDGTMGHKAYHKPTHTHLCLNWGSHYHHSKKHANFPPWCTVVSHRHIQGEWLLWPTDSQGSQSSCGIAFESDCPSAVPTHHQGGQLPAARPGQPRIEYTGSIQHPLLMWLVLHLRCVQKVLEIMVQSSSKPFYSK